VVHLRKRGLLLRGLGTLTFLVLSYYPALSFLVSRTDDRGCSTLTFWNTLECEQLASLSVQKKKNWLACPTYGCT
jgi:hypothetical protein